MSWAWFVFCNYRTVHNGSHSEMVWRVALKHSYRGRFRKIRVFIVYYILWLWFLVGQLEVGRLEQENCAAFESWDNNATLTKFLSDLRTSIHVPSRTWPIMLFQQDTAIHPDTSQLHERGRSYAAVPHMSFRKDSRLEWGPREYVRTSSLSRNLSRLIQMNVVNVCSAQYTLSRQIIYN